MNARISTILAALLLGFGTAGAIAVAGSTSDTQTDTGCLDAWPGNGYGDDNHVHTGEPPESGIWCGNGNGDTNKDHQGPPGQFGT